MKLSDRWVMVSASARAIAKSVKVLCDALGIWCMIALCGNNPEKGIKYRHTWNIVRIGGTVLSPGCHLRQQPWENQR
ncbi:MAG: hypothetical protein ACLUAR_04510 [Pilosibacter sp.]